RHNWAQVGRWGLEMADALRYVKETLSARSEREVDEDFGHRDLHPGNIMIVEDASGALHTKLLDFGLARLPDDSSTISSLVKRHGNAFMPYRDPYWPNGGVQGDIFSLGAILYELVSGRRPYPDDYLTEYQRTRKCPEELISHLRPLPHAAPEDFAAILRRMIH